MQTRLSKMLEIASRPSTNVHEASNAALKFVQACAREGIDLRAAIMTKPPPAVRNADYLELEARWRAARDEAARYEQARQHASREVTRLRRRAESLEAEIARRGVRQRPFRPTARQRAIYEVVRSSASQLEAEAIRARLPAHLRGAAGTIYEALKRLVDLGVIEALPVNPATYRIVAQPKVRGAEIVQILRTPA